MSIAGSSSIRRLKDVAVVLGLNELVQVGRRSPRGCDWWRLEWFAEVCENLTSRGRSHPGLRPLANLRFEVSRLLPAVSSRPDVATAGGALERKLLPHPRDQFRPGNPRGVVRAGLLIRICVTAAPRRATVERRKGRKGDAAEWHEVKALVVGLKGLASTRLVVWS